jgi:hypothetical protein
MNREDSGVGPPRGSYAGAHRAPPRARKSVAVRAITVGGAALCIGFSAEMNAPDAEALSILLPMGNGSATQINILEGNVIDPQVNPAGNTSNDTTIGNIMLGNTPQGSSDIVVPIGSSGAAGYGNVTQVNILSYNIINPQASLFGDNISNNTTVSNVSAGNGNGAPASNTSGLIGLAQGSGNTTQIALLSGNIFNPQASLFGSNTSNNTAATNISVLNGNGVASGIFASDAFSAINGSGNTNQVAGASGNIANPQFSLLGSNTSGNTALVNQSWINGNGSPTAVQDDGLGTFLVGLTGSGNSNQGAGLVSNIWNTQGTLGGYNSSDNTAGSNNAGLNGNWSPTDVSSTNGGNNTIFGQVGAGDVNQAGQGNGNISNDQFRLFTGLTQPGQSTGNSVQQNDSTISTEQTTVNQPTVEGEGSTPSGGNPEDAPALNNAQVSSGGQQGTGTGTGKNANGILLFPNGQGGTGGGLSPLGQKVADAVKNASDAVKGALSPNKGDGSTGGGG